MSAKATEKSKNTSSSKVLRFEKAKRGSKGKNNLLMSPHLDHVARLN